MHFIAGGEELLKRAKFACEGIDCRDGEDETG